MVFSWSSFLLNFHLEGLDSFLEQKVVIHDDADGAGSIYAADIDGDGDIDIVDIISKV